jgi:hypothetical protein
MSYLVRRAAVAVVVAVSALGTAGISPAAAAAVPTRSEVVSALLRAGQLPDGWHRATQQGIGALDTSGCDARSRGVKRSAHRSFRYSSQPLFADETVRAYGTADAARLDVRRAVRKLAACDSLTVGGHAWTVRRIPMRSIGDQRAVFELKGLVTTATGDVTVTRWVGLARLGQEVAATTFTVGGPIAAGDVGTMRDVARGLLARSLSKVDNVLVPER